MSQTSTFSNHVNISPHPRFNPNRATLFVKTKYWTLITLRVLLMYLNVSRRPNIEFDSFLDLF